MTTLNDLLSLPVDEKIRRFDQICRETFSHVDGRDLLLELHPRSRLDVKRRVDGRETWFEADWLSNLMEARNGPRIPPGGADDWPAGSSGAEACERGSAIA